MHVKDMKVGNTADGEAKAGDDLNLKCAGWDSIPVITKVLGSATEV